jgi:ABC-2 type transport system ATP-binding protein
MKILVRNLYKKIDNNLILKNINIEFEKGNIYALIGRNGSGKSVFLKTLCGFYKPTSGTVLYNDTDIYNKNIFAPSTRALIERPKFIPDISGRKNIELLLDIQNIVDKKEIDFWAEKLNMQTEIDKIYSKYSLGTKQKLGIMQVFIENPEVLIFDEPLNGIESETANIVRNIIKEAKNNGKIIIIATHIKEDFVEIADYIYKFENGEAIKL